MGWLVIVLPLLALAVLATASRLLVVASTRRASKLPRRGDVALPAPRQGSRVAVTVSGDEAKYDWYAEPFEYVAYYEKSRYRSWPP